MKEIKRYVCEICNTEYKDLLSAKKCEKTHKGVKRIINAKYLPFTMNAAGYPVSVVIEMENGEQLTYKR